jgi:hypothetical protein
MSNDTGTGRISSRHRPRQWCCCVYFTSNKHDNRRRPKELQADLKRHLHTAPGPPSCLPHSDGRPPIITQATTTRSLTRPGCASVCVPAAAQHKSPTP